MLFLTVFLVFLISYGVGMTSVLTPQKVKAVTLKGILLFPFLDALGNVDVDVYPESSMFIVSLTLFLSKFIVRRNQYGKGCALRKISDSAM